MVLAPSGVITPGTVTSTPTLDSFNCESSVALSCSVVSTFVAHLSFYNPPGTEVSMPILGPVGSSAVNTVTCDTTTGNWNLPDTTVLTQYACYKSGPACPCPAINTLQRSFANTASVDSPLTYQPILNLQGCETGAVVTCKVPAGFTSFLQLITLAGATNTVVGGVNQPVIQTANCNSQFGQWSFTLASINQFVQFQALGCTYLNNGGRK